MSKKSKVILYSVILVSAGILLILSFTGITLKKTDLISSFFFRGNQVDRASMMDYNMPPQWKYHNAGNIEIRKYGKSFIMRPDAESSGPWNTSMIYRKASGDFYFSSLVRTRKRSDILSYPENNHEFAGLIVRNSAVPGDNIFLAVGCSDSLLAVEVISGTKGSSDITNFDWPSGDAELMIRRETDVFGLYARPYGTASDWIKIQTIYRSDFPDQVETGLTAYSFSHGTNNQDLTAYFDRVKLWRDHE